MPPGWWPLPTPTVEEERGGPTAPPSARVVSAAALAGTVDHRPGSPSGPECLGAAGCPRGGEQRGQSRRGLKDHVC